MKGRMMKQLVRITGHNGVIYEEWMTHEQIRQFLRLTETNISLGVAFEEWEITITEHFLPSLHSSHLIFYTVASY
jgi:hypothetical protein